MKKLFRHEWKYYLLFTIVMTVILISNQNFEWIWDMHYEEIYNYEIEIGFMVETLSRQLNEYLLGSSVLIVLIGILALKAVFFWQEKDSYGREFFQTLPVTRIDRLIFHFVMDGLAIVIPVICSALYSYFNSMKYLNMILLRIPGLATAIFGKMIVSIGYLLFMLCLINVLECLFAGGFTRIVGTAGNIFIGYWSLYFISILNEKSLWIQGVYKFFVPGTLLTGYESLWDWEDITVYGRGEPVTLSPVYDAAHFFSNADKGWYIGCLAGYVVLAVVLAATAVFLAGKQEQSKRDFYFVFGRYLTSGLISVAFCGMLLLNATAVWHKCLIVLASILLFIVLSYWMDLDRKPLKNIQLSRKHRVV